MKPKILLVDDEPNIIHSYSRGLRKDWDLVTAMSGEEGLRAIQEQGPFSVIVSDFNMPRMDGITFLSKTIEISPETVRMVLTGEGDFHIATKAVNEGNIFRFITKPCPLEQLVKALQKGYHQYRLQQLEKEAHRQELVIAGEIQKTLLVEGVPVGFSELDIAAVTVPSRDVDGDFIDFFRFNDRRLDVVIGDVMGKGLHAAMVGAGARNQLARVLWQLSLKNVPQALEPDSIMETFKQAMAAGLDQVQIFITMMYARFDVAAHKLTFVDAGHTPILWYSAANRAWREVKGSGGPVGLPFKNPFEQKEVAYGSGDLFLFYSDGLWDGRNTEKQAYGSAALRACAERLVGCPAAEFVAAMLEDYRRFVVPGPFFDDLTMVLVRAL
ncbi:MAG TPA: SpoIIE family protein phosphatase [Candidatus Rifleibacterium sp.]|nr:SpoIIE family protein phosphatase [Candidatus Rifleibacterium sp.]HPT44670.1 SpoIIE family protein phosphatase [Candidatus Rifleibacterium sp.]